MQRRVHNFHMRGSWSLQTETQGFSFLNVVIIKLDFTIFGVGKGRPVLLSSLSQMPLPPAIHCCSREEWVLLLVKITWIQYNGNYDVLWQLWAQGCSSNVGKIPHCSLCHSSKHLIHFPCFLSLMFLLKLITWQQQRLATGLLWLSYLSWILFNIIVQNLLPFKSVLMFV